jgi:4-hydroxybenzoate polyprenyltransferase
MAKRLWTYLAEMYPLSSWLGTFLSGLMVYAIIFRLHGLTLQIDRWVVASCFSLCLFSLLLRVMDEFKDYEDDKKNFPHRPLPSGKVLHKDLKVLGWSCVGLSLLLSSWSLETLALASLVLIYSVLMLKWFFAEKQMRRSLPLAFFSHHPIVIYHFFYLLVGASILGEFDDIPLMLLVIPLCLMMTNWEIARKIRKPQDESEYTTYSKIWGPRKAVLVAIICQLILLITVLTILAKYFAQIWWSVGFATVFCSFMSPYIFFWIKFKVSKPLKFWAELQIIWIVVFMLAASWLA